MEEIKVWLNSPINYAAGIKLYLQHGHDRQLKNLFTLEAESEFKRSRLYEALKELYENYQNPTTKKAAISRQLQKQNPSENFKYWPPLPIEDPVLASLHEKWKPIYSEMMSLQARIHDIALQGQKDQGKAMEACQMVHRILDIDDQCDEVYATRDFYYQNGHLPQLVIHEPVIGDPVRWATKMKNAERYIREYKAKLKKDPSNVRFAGQLKKHEQQLDKYRKLLKLD